MQSGWLRDRELRFAANLQQSCRWFSYLQGDRHRPCREYRSHPSISHLDCEYRWTDGYSNHDQNADRYCHCFADSDEYSYIHPDEHAHAYTDTFSNSCSHATGTVVHLYTGCRCICKVNQCHFEFWHIAEFADRYIPGYT